MAQAKSLQIDEHVQAFDAADLIAAELQPDEIAAIREATDLIDLVLLQQQIRDGFQLVLTADIGNHLTLKVDGV